MTETYYHGGFLIRDSARPTCPEGAQLQLTINVSCYPAPTFTWTKDGQQIGKKVSGGTARQRGEEQVKEKSSESSASNQQHAVPAQEFQRRVEPTEKKGVTDFWKKQGKSISIVAMSHLFYTGMILETEFYPEVHKTMKKLFSNKIA